MNKAMAQIKFPKLRFKSLIVILLLGLSLSSLFVVLGGAKVEALDGSNFNAGHIIDDSVFFVYLSIKKIQQIMRIILAILAMFLLGHRARHRLFITLVLLMV